MGEPKATDMPAAAAAESTSRFLATSGEHERRILSHIQLEPTFILVQGVKKFHYQVCAATCNVNQGSLFAEPEPRSDSQALYEA